MDIKLRLKILSFLEFFIWGSYLTSLGTYMFVSLKFSGPEIGSIFTTLGISSLFMPALFGIIADKYVNSEKLLAVIHSISALFLIWASTVQDSSMMFWIMLLVAMFYMPTIALVNSISYNLLNRNNLDVIKDFPAIRVWGTIGFIVAMWVVDLLGWIVSKNQFYVGAFSGFLMAIFSFFLPACPPAKSVGQKSWVSILGLDAFVLMKQPKMLIFFVFSMLLGAALQITNMLGQDFLECQCVNLVAEEIEHISGMCGHIVKNTVKLDGSENDKGCEYPQQQPKVTDTIDDKRLDRRRRCTVFMIPETDQQIRRLTRPLPIRRKVAGYYRRIPTLTWQR